MENSQELIRIADLLLQKAGIGTTLDPEDKRYREARDIAMGQAISTLVIAKELTYLNIQLEQEFDLRRVERCP